MRLTHPDWWVLGYDELVPSEVARAGHADARQQVDVLKNVLAKIAADAHGQPGTGCLDE